MKHTSSLSAFAAVLAFAAAPAMGDAAVPQASAPAAAEGAGPPALVLPFDFARAVDGRVFADVPLPPAPERAAAVGLVFDAPVPPGPVRGVSIHLHSGNGWLSADLPVSRACGAVRIPFSAFSPEGDPGPAAAADTLRLSLWARAAEGTGTVSLVSARLIAPAPVAVAGEGLGAERCGRILNRIGVPFDLLPATGFSEEDLAAVRVLLLPDAASLAPRDITAVRAFVRRGGRPVVFYSPDPRLADALGLRPGAWEGGSWSGLSVSGSGRRIPHQTENRICPRHGANARVLAVWVDSLGRETAEPAVVLAPRGAWFAHIPPRAYPATCDLFRTVLSSLAEGIVEPPAAEGPAASLAAALPSGFPLAAWASAPERDVPPALRALFVRVAAGAPIPEAAGTNAPALHAWLPCLLAGDGSWLDPADPDVRRAAAAEAARLVQAGAAGVSLDYVRTAAGVPATPERAAAVTALVREVSAAVRAASPKAVVSAAVFPTPSEAASVNQDWPTWVKEGAVDFVAPMIYTDDPATFRAKLDACLSAAPAAALVPGIGTGADESQTDLPATAAELSACVSVGCRGAAFFALDDALRELLR